MNPSIQDLLVFVGIPLATTGIIFALVYASPGGRGTKRYRPGRPYTFASVWFLARPDKDGPAGRSAQAMGHVSMLGELETPAHSPLEPSAPETSEASMEAAVAVRQHPGVTGGASDRW